MSTSLTVEYIQGADLPDLAIEWRDSDGEIIDYSSGHTFSLRVGNPGSAATVSKTNGFTGAAVSPNITVSWETSGELNTITPGTYDADLIATRSSDSKQRILRFALTVRPAVAAA